uniref:Uncharacterized protein n=1 Tax=viral metagenome TaxID=1070528 RepID=A0A6C0HV66_9ZZZZ
MNDDYKYNQTTPSLLGFWINNKLNSGYVVKKKSTNKVTIKEKSTDKKDDIIVKILLYLKRLLIYKKN